MKTLAVALIAAVSVLVVAAAFATAHMYNYGVFLGSADNAFREKMQDEMNEVFDLQQKYQSGEITQEQYQQGIQEHWSEMRELHQQYGFGCPMTGAGSAPGRGMMGYGMMWGY